MLDNMLRIATRTFPQRLTHTRAFSTTLQHLQTMKALVYKGPGQKALESVPKPGITKPTDAIVKLIGTTICGTDLHIVKGDVPETTSGTILGHEGIGIVESVGSDVSDIKANDKVLISCVTACNDCSYCAKNMQSHCVDGGWILGHLINGTQAQYVRIPHASSSLYPIKHLEGKVDDEALLMLSDILPTGNEIGALNGKIEEGDIVAIVGCGSVGISALIAAKTFNPGKVIMIDFDDERLRVAKESFGADYTINPSKVSVDQEIARVCSEVNVASRADRVTGVDVAIECVGIPQTFQTCQDIIAPGGRIANVGVHGTKVDLQLQDLWIKNINISTGLVSAYSTQDLLEKVSNKELNPRPLVTHQFKFDQIIEAYDVFKNSSKEKCIKVYLKFD